MDKNAKIYVAGHHGLVGSAIWKNLQEKGYTNLVGRTHKELDLLDGVAVRNFFDEEQPEYVFLAAASWVASWPTVFIALTLFTRIYKYSRMLSAKVFVTILRNYYS